MRSSIITSLKKYYQIFRIGMFLVCAGAVIIVSIHVIATITYRGSLYRDLSHVPKHTYALILGAGLWADGSPSDILSDRLKAGYELYKAGKVTKIIVSGDNRFTHYSEPDSMKKTLMTLGVPEDRIQTDYAGRRTYDSCYRAKHIFSIDKLIVVTQSFHLTRSVFLCNQLGIKSVGYSADANRYDPISWMYWSVRDILSFTMSLIDVYIRHPSVVGGEKIQF
jgi:SanA protein